MHQLNDRLRHGSIVAQNRREIPPRLNRTRLILAAMSATGALLAASAVEAGTDTWTGNTTANFNALDGFNSVPVSNDALVFGAAGSTGTSLTDNLLTPAAFNISGITFNSGASAFTINPAISGTNGFTLTGNILNSGTATETINDIMTVTAARTITTTTGGGNIILGGLINGSGGSLTIAGTGTTSFSASNLLSSSTNLAMATGAITNVLDLAGTTQTVGTLTSSSTTGSGGLITSSASGGSLTINEGTTNGNVFGGTQFSGSLALTVRGTSLSAGTGNQPQITNTNNTFTGGLTIQGSSGTLTTANLAISGGLSTTGLTTQGLRYNSGLALGAGTVTLDNGQLFGVTGASAITDNIAVTSRGGVIHDEVNGAVFSGTLSSTGTPLLVINSNSGNTNTLSFNGSNASFSGTIAIDTTNIGGIKFGSNALGNSNINLLWFGDGANGGTGQIESGLTAGGTLTFGEFNNLNSGSVGSTFSGIVENAVASTTSTFSIGDSNSVAATFQGVIKNGTGTVALTKTGSNTQILSGANTYTGATAVNGGVLEITGSLPSGTTTAVNTGGTLLSMGSGVVNGPVNVNGGGIVGGSGSVSGLITLATGSTNASAGEISVVGNNPSTFTVSNAAGLTLGGTSGNFAAIGLDAGNKIAVTGPLTVNAGGASIYITPGTAAANSTYTLLTYGSGTGAGFTVGSGAATEGSITLTDPSLSFGVSGTLNVSSTAITLVTAGASAPATAYWSGIQGTNWNATNVAQTQGNFTTNLAGTTFVTALPGSSTNVYFAGTGATNLTNNVTGQAFNINCLTYLSSTGAVATTVTNTLTIQGGGITQNNSGGSTISGGTLILGAAQSWTNNTSTAFTVSSTVSGTVGLTLTGGPVNLGGSSFTSGSLTVNDALDVKGTSISTGNFNGSGSITNTGSTSATLTANITANQIYSGTLADGGAGKTLSIFKSGTAQLTLGGAGSYTGTTVIGAGTIAIGTSTSLGSSATTIDNLATLDLNGQTITNTLSAIGVGATGEGGAIINSNTATGAMVSSDILSSSSFTVGGAGSIAFQRIQSGNTFTLTDADTGTLTLGTAGTTNHNNLLSLVVNSGGTVLLNMPANFIAIDRGLTLVSGTVQFTGASTDELSNNYINISGGTLDFNGHTDSPSFGYLLGTGGIVTNTAASTTSLVNIGTATTNTYAGIITDGPSSGVIGVTIVGAGGIETFSGANNYSGGTTISGTPTLIMGNATALGTVPANLNVSGGTLDLDGHNLSVTTFNGSSATAVITSSGNTGAVPTLTVNSSTNATYAGQINNGTGGSPDTLALVKNGSNALTLSASSTYSGGTTIKAGTIIQTTAGAVGTGTITLGDGSTSTAATLQGDAGSTLTNTNPIVVAAGGTGVYTIKQTTGSDYDFSGPVTLNNVLTLETTSNGAMFLSGNISGSSLITIDGGNSTTKFVQFSGNNAASFTGNLLIQNKGSFKTNTNGLGAATTVTMDSSGTIFDTGANSVTVAGFNDVVPGAGGSSLINAGTGSNLTLAGSGTYSYSGVISNSGFITKSGTGTQILSGVNTYTGSTNVSGGTLTFAAPGALPNFASTLNIGANATVIAANHGVAPKNTLFAKGLSIAGSSGAWTGKLDLSNNDMVVQNGNLANLTDQVKQGFNGGVWNNSTGGIVSSVAAADSTHLTALGVIQNTADGSSTLYSSFDGATASAITDVLVKYTYYGDTNLDGKVDASDYSRIDNAYVNGGSGWFNGDFNYDGVINGSDYTLIDNAFNTQGTQLSAEIATPTAEIAGAAGSSAVPEPTTLSLIGIGAVGLLGRRRRSR